jgi:hypothetical protein
LDYVGQIVDRDESVIINHANQVSASGFLADTNQLMFVNVKQISPTKVELDFESTKFQLVEIFGQSGNFGKKIADIKPFEIKFDNARFAEQIKKSGRSIPGLENGDAKGFF